MRKFMFIMITSVLALGTLSAQEKDGEKPKFGWEKEVVGNLNFTQNKFDNWSQGGEDSWSWQLDINGKFVYDQPKYKWSNSGKISYGKTKVADGDAKKSADEIKLESVYSYKMNLYVNPYVSVSGLTQMTKGYQYTDTSRILISDFMDPGYFTQSVGLGFEPNKVIKTRLGAAIKETITKDFAARYGDGEKTRVEYGAESVTELNTKLAENIVFTSKLEMFSNLNRFDEVDVNWDNMFSSKIAKYLAVSLNVKLFYDKDVSHKRQLKETLAVGLTYSFL